MGKLRKIIIDDLEYLYGMGTKYNLATETSTLTVKIFLNGQKQTPLVIEFLTIDHYYFGQVLSFGIILTNRITNTADKVNLNQPKYIRELILLGRKKGWKGNNKIETQNGLDYLTELGYETDVLRPTNKNER